MMLRSRWPGTAASDTLDSLLSSRLLTRVASRGGKSTAPGAASDKCEFQSWGGCIFVIVVKKWTMCEILEMATVL